MNRKRREGRVGSRNIDRQREPQSERASAQEIGSKQNLNANTHMARTHAIQISYIGKYSIGCLTVV